MNKQEMVGYLVNLHNLIEAQMKGQHSVPSAKLADEYNKYWELLKEEIKKADGGKPDIQPVQKGKY